MSKTNKDLYEDLKLKLFSQNKDGVPKGIFQRLIGWGYPIALIVIWVIAIIGAIKLRKIWKWKVFAIVFTLCSITGWLWGIYIEKYDPEFPGWLFLPWSICNLEFLLTLEDWLFYPACTFLFYYIFRAIKEDRNNKNENLKIWTSIIHILITCFFCYFTAICGKSLAIQCAIPAIVLFFYAWDYWDIRHYFKFMGLVLVFEILWDYLAVSWLSYIPGMAWASQWVYITFDIDGNYLHSKVFLDYAKYPWAWIFKNPIEITPWFGLSVGMYFYALMIAVEKFLCRKK